MSAIGLATVMLASGVKGFFEDSSYLLGIPLLALGVLGALLALGTLSPVELRWPERREIPEQELLPPPEGHPTAPEYIRIGIILAVITVVEVAFYYIDVATGALLGILLTLSMMKFALVVLWFMHLRFDSPFFSVLFSGGLALVTALFIVVLATLGANLI